MDVGALGRSVTAVLRVDAASCGSHFASGDANSTPASCGLRLWKSGQWQACFLAALRAAGWRAGRPHPAGSWVARRTNAPPASLPAELADRTTYRMSAPLTSARGRGSYHGREHRDLRAGVACPN